MNHTYKISGMSCQGCSNTVKSALESIPDISSVQVHLDKHEAVVSMDRHVPITALRTALAEAGGHYDIHLPHEYFEATHSPPDESDHGTGNYYCPMLCEGDRQYEQPGDCPKCGMHLVKEEKVSPAKIAEYTCPMHPEVVRNKPGSCPICGMDLELKAIVEVSDHEEDHAYKEMLVKFWLALAFTLPVFFIAMSEMVGISLKSIAGDTTWGLVQMVLTTPVVFYCSRKFFVRGYHSVLNKSPNMWTLISLGAGAAYIFSVIGLILPDIFPDQFKTAGGGVHLYFESAAVILTLILLGQVLELRARGQTNSAIRELLNLVPVETTVIRDGEEHIIPLEQVNLHDIIKVKPGEKIPVDGIMVNGESNIDESMITGEPIPVQKSEGAEVIGGTINGTGTFQMKALKVGSDTLLSQIVEMVNKASRTKAPIQNLADKVSGYFVPIVVAIAVISFAVWAIWGPNPSLVYAFTSAVTVLIIACPCALGLATPMSIMVGTGKGAKQGVLVRDAGAIEEMNQVTILVTDKTGTITEGKPSLQHIQTLNPAYTNREILSIAAALEHNSEHPLAHAILSAAEADGITLQPIEEFDSVTGQGVTGKMNGKIVAIGNMKLLEKYRIPLEKELMVEIESRQAQAETVMFVIVDKVLSGLISVSDPIKRTSASAIADLQDQGLSVIMLTGDNNRTAKAVAEQLNLNGFYADLLPQDKLKKVKELQQQGKKVAMAGDGINDAPALAQADVGIAMGTGTDVAIESASLTLVKGELNGIVRARKLSTEVMRNIKQNLFFAFIYNTLGVPIAAGILFPFFGLLLSPMLAALAMSLSSVSVIANSLRLR